MKKLVGIEVDKQNIKVATMKRKKDAIVLIDTFMTETPEGAVQSGKIMNPDIIVDQIRQIAKIMKFSQTDDIFLACADSVTSVTSAFEKSANHAAWIETAKSDRMGNVNLAISFASVVQMPNGYAVCSTAVEKEYIEKIIEAFKEKKLALRAIEATGVAMQRYFYGVDESFVLVDIDPESISMNSFIDQVGFYSSSVPGGSEQMIANPTIEASQFAQSLTAHMMATESNFNQKIPTVVVTGIHDNLRDFINDELSKANNYGTLIPDTYQPDWVHGVNIESDRAFFTCIGLCLRPLFEAASSYSDDGEGIKNILVSNLMDDMDVKELEWERFKKTVLMGFGIMALIMGLATMYCLSSLVWTDNPKHKMTSEFEKDYTTAVTVQTDYNNVVKQMNEVASQKIRMTPVLDQLNLLKQGVVFTKISIEGGSKKVLIEGFGQNNDIGVFVQSLQNSGYLKDVQMSETPAGKGSTANFKINGQLQ